MSDQPWLDYQPQAAAPGRTLIRPGNPYTQHDQAGDAQHKDLENRRLSSQTPFDGRIAAAKATKDEADAVMASQKADEVKATSAMAQMGPNSQLHGDAYLQAFVPPSQWNLVKAYANGDLGSRAGSMSTSMLPIIQHAMNYDPTTSATSFPAKVKMQSDLASNDPKSLGGGLKAVERMALHGSDVLDSSAKLDNYGPGFQSLLNYPKIGLERMRGDVRIGNLEENVRNYAPEAQKAISGGLGGEAERLGRASAFAPSSSQAYIAAGLQADARQAFQSSLAGNDQYRRLFGKDIKDSLSDQTKSALNKIMAGGYDEQGKPLYPAENWTPLTLSGNAPPPTGGTGSTPPMVGGNPPSGGPVNASTRLGFSPGGGPGAPLAPSTAAYRQESDPITASYINKLVRAGASADEINKGLPAGYPPVDQKTVTDAYNWTRNNPNNPASVGGALHYVQQTIPQRIAASAPVVALDGVVRGATAGLGMIPANALTALTSGQTYRDAAIGNEAKYQGANAAQGGIGTLGEIGGGIAGTIMGGQALNATKLAPWIAANPRLAALAGDAAYGSTYGASTTPDNPFGGAVTGALSSVGGNLAGRAATNAIGGTMRGVSNDAVNYLASRNIPMTGGQTAGGLLKSLEDKATSLPGVGNLINARRTEGLNALNLTAQNDAVGGGVSKIGADGADQMQAKTDMLYGNALNGKSVRVDQHYLDAQPGVEAAVNAIPAVGPDLHQALATNIGPLFQPGGVLTGDNMQAGIRTLQQLHSGYSDSPFYNLPNGIKPALDGVQNQLTGLFERQAPEVMPAFNEAQAAYGNKQLVQKAQKSAGAGDTPFTADQLNRASINNTSSFGGANLAASTDRPFYDLAVNARDVLPSKIPNSGTSDRMWLAGALGLGGSGGLGGASGYANGDTAGGAETGAGFGLGAMGLMAGLNTKAGQKALTLALLKRPDLVRQAGNGLLNYAPILGQAGAGAATPLLMQNAQ